MSLLPYSVESVAQSLGVRYLRRESTRYCASFLDESRTMLMPSNERTEKSLRAVQVRTGRHSRILGSKSAIEVKKKEALVWIET